nr:type IV pili twitching motility protein PilT [Bacillota bacterium]
MLSIQEILKNARQENCSDVHITQGSPIAIRKNGLLTATDMRPDIKETERLILSLCSEKQIVEVKQGKDQDFAYSLPDGTRHRVNVYGQMNGLAAA